MNLIKNRKGAEINITTIIVIILAVLVLVILALYFTGGMKSLWEQITGKKAAWDTSAIEDAKQACRSQCTGQNVDFFCYHAFTIGKEKDGTPIPAIGCYGGKINAENFEECKTAGFDASMCTPTPTP